MGTLQGFLLHAMFMWVRFFPASCRPEEWVLGNFPVQGDASFRNETIERALQVQPAGEKLRLDLVIEFP